MEKKVNLIISSLLDRIAPSRMREKEIEKLASVAGISPETIRQIRKRKSLSAQTLIRLLLAVGVSEKSIIHLPETDPIQLTSSLNAWNELGRKISEKERVQFLKLIEYIRAEWKLK